VIAGSADAVIPGKATALVFQFPRVVRYCKPLPCVIADSPNPNEGEPNTTILWLLGCCDNFSGGVVEVGGGLQVWAGGRAAPSSSRALSTLVAFQPPRPAAP